MKILQICPKPPLPAIDGGCLASYRLSLDLQKSGCQVDICAMATAKHPYIPDQIDSEYSEEFNLRVQSIDTEPSVISVISNLLANESIQKKRFYSPEFQIFLTDIVKNKKYDVVILDGLMAAFYLQTIQKHTNATCIYRSHNVEWDLLAQMNWHRVLPFYKNYINLQSKRLRREEELIWKNSHIVWAISDSDRHIIEKVAGANKVKWVPFSIGIPEHIREGDRNKVFHLGAMDWLPNREGILWFIREVWPLVLKIRPHTEFHIGGKNIEKYLRDLEAENVIVHREIEDATQFMQQFAIMVVPILSGGGTRIKILQGLANERAVVSTSKGVDGMKLTHEKEIMVSDDPAQFAGYIIQLIEEDGVRNSLRESGLAFIRENHTSESVVRKIRQSLESISKNPED